MKITSQQLGAIFIAILMIGSILGFALWSKSDDQSPQQPTDTTDIVPSSIPFKAEGIEAKVIQVFNSVIVSGNTKETDIGRIDSEIKSISGVRQINSKYAGLENPALAGGMNYIAFVSFDSSKTTAGLMQEIEAKTTYLDSVEGIAQGLVNIPKKITLINADLNLTKEHEFEETRTNAYLSIGTMKDDELIVSLDASLAENRAMGQTAFEEKNLTGEPKQVFLEKEFELNELANELKVKSTGKLIAFSSEEEIDLLMEEIDGAEKSETQVISTGNLTKAEFNSIEENQIADLNEFVLEKEGVFEFDENKSTALIKYFGENQKEFLSELNEKLNKFDLKELSEPKVSFTSVLTLNEGANIQEIAEKTIQEMQSIDFESEAMQKAIINADSIYSEDLNESFELEKGNFEAMVFLGHKKGETVSLQVFFYGIRGKAEYIMAEENPEETTIE
ncbi:MAG: hypothetical protein ABIA76_01965 [Candidatus Diapherotrites archaeon]